MAKRVMVIARAFGGEPIARILCEIGQRVAYLANPDFIDRVESGDSEPVGFPLTDVFKWDEAIYTELRNQWTEAGDTFPSTWAQLELLRI